MILMVENKYYVIDSHCHIYPEKIAERAVKGTDDFYSAASQCKGTVDDLIKRGNMAGIDRFVVQSVATTPKQVTSINEFIAASVREAPDRLIGLGTLHPESDDLAADIRHILDLGFKGVKLHPDIQQFKIDDYRCLKIYELCEREGLPILMHTGDYRYDFSNPNRLLPILKIYTSLTVIGAHLGGWSVWDEAARTLCDVPNLWVDCSSCFGFISRERVEELIKCYGADKVLFGTDYPMWTPDKEIETFLKMDLSERDRKKIFSENAIKLFDIKV